MFEKINKKSLVAVLLVGTMTVAGATTAFAADRVNGNRHFAKNGTTVRADISQMSAKIKAAVDKLVTAGTITQAQEDAVLKVFTPGQDKNRPQHMVAGERKNPMDELVTAGTITQAQLDTIHEAMKSAFESKKTMADVLSSLVADGTITQEQSNAISQKLPVKNENIGPKFQRKNPMSELVTAGTITQAQLDAVESAMKTARENKQTMKDALAGLVTAGTITQEQSDAISKLIPERQPGFGIKRGPAGEHKGFISSLVTAGTITQAQLDSINEAVKAGMEAKKPMADIISGLVTAGTITQEQADAITKAMPAKAVKAMPGIEHKNPLSELVTAGTITQAQADAINAAVKSVFAAPKK